MQACEGTSSPTLQCLHEIEVYINGITIILSKEEIRIDNELTPSDFNEGAEIYSKGDVDVVWMSSHIIAVRTYAMEILYDRHHQLTMRLSRSYSRKVTIQNLQFYLTGVTYSDRILSVVRRRPSCVNLL